MSIRRCVLLAAFVLLAVVTFAQTRHAATTAPATVQRGFAIVQSGSEKWGDIPDGVLVGTPSVPLGGTLKVAVIQGDPSKPNRTYTLRASCTDGTKIAPHWHPTTENVTVISGALTVGMGSKWDDAALKDVPAGAFFSATPHMPHFAACKGDSVFQIHGVGPFVINFVGPDEKPAEKPAE